jgi:hypothetical protein
MVSEWVFARRMGIEITGEALILCGPMRRISISWGSIQRVEWKETRRLMSRTQFLFIQTDEQSPRRILSDAPVKVPAVAYAGESDLPNDRLLGPYLTSRNLRSADGREADALALLERIRTQLSE